MRIMPKGTRWSEIFKCKTTNCPAILEVKEPDVFIIIHGFKTELCYMCPNCREINLICRITSALLDDESFIKAFPLFKKVPLGYEEWRVKFKRAEQKRSLREKQRNANYFRKLADSIPFDPFS